MRLRRTNKPRRVIHDVGELPYLCDCADAGLLLRKNPEVIARDGILPGQAWYFRRDDLISYMDKLFGEAQG